MTTRPNKVLTRDLTPADFEVLEFERGWWKYRGRREAVIRERFGTSATRHTQRVQALIDHPQAMAYDAQLVGRLRDTRDAHLARRAHEARILEELDR